MNDILAQKYKVCLPLLSTYSAGRRALGIHGKIKTSGEPLSDDVDMLPYDGDESKRTMAAFNVVARHHGPHRRAARDYPL